MHTISMNKEEYKKIAKKYTYKENKYINYLKSFIFGGLMGTLGQFLSSIYQKYLVLNVTDSYALTFVTLVVISSILTGLGFFDDIVSFARCGLIVPSTGFAHAMTSAAMDYRKEGFVKGIGANIFKLTGSIILFGIVSAYIFVLVRVVIL